MFSKCLKPVDFFSIKLFLEILILLASISCLYEMSFIYCSIQIYYTR